jgi:hypothetical protein
MTAHSGKVRLENPFVFGLNPKLYPMIASWFVEQPDLGKDLEKARAALEATEHELQRKIRAASLLKVCRARIDAYRKHREKETPEEEGDDFTGVLLRELCQYARFYREVKAQMGCAGRPLKERMAEDLAGLVKAYAPLIQPKAVFAAYDCSFANGGVRLHALDTPFDSTSLYRFYTSRLRSRDEEEYASYESDSSRFAPPDHCYLFAATIGPGIDETVARLSDEGETYQALLVNALGAGAADMTAFDLELYLNHILKPDEGTWWRRFHVGYGDFRLQEQRRLFELLDPGRIGIRLNEACLMLPEKSVSGMLAPKRRRA